jgi:hypothetical protein
VLRGRAAGGLGAADGPDLAACGAQVTAELRRYRFKCDPVGDSFHEDDGHVRKLA